MATSTQVPEAAAATRRSRFAGLRTWTSALRHALDRPLTSYYLLLGASALLLTIGLIMVLSASSVYSFRVYDDSYAIVEKQLLWVAIGIPCAWVASRLPLRWIRRLAYPGYAVSLTLLLLTAFLGVERNGNTNWLALGPIVIQPSEIAKLALILWAAHVYANKDRRLASTHQIMIPVVPGLLIATGLVVFGRDLGTALVLFAILLGMLWVVGAPARFFMFSISVVGVLALYLATTNKERMARITTFVDPFSDYHTAGWQPAHGLYALSSGGWFGQGIGASQQKWGTLPEAHTDFIFAVLGEELGLVGTLLVILLFVTIAFAAIRVATATADPFVRYMSLRHRGVAARPDDDQRRHGAGDAAGHRHPAAPGLVRRLGPGALARGARPARRVRAPRARGGGGAAPAPPVPLGRVCRPDGCRAARSSRLTTTCAYSWPAVAPPDTPLPCWPPPTPCAASTPDVEITCLGTARGLETRVVPEAGYAARADPARPDAAQARRRPAQGAGAAAGRRPRHRGHPRPPRRRGRRRVRRLRLDAGVPRRPPSPDPDRPPRAERQARPGEPGRCSHRAPGRGVLPGHAAAEGGVRRPAAPADDRGPRPGRPARGGPSLLRPRPRPAHPAGDRRVAGRPQPQPGGVRRVGRAGRRRRPGPARRRPER